MRIFVDELPKDCLDCPMHDGENGWCKILVCYTDYIPKDCPIQSLADYTKQVREEVCEKIQEIADLDDWEEINGYTLKKILDQIQGETK